MKKGKYLLIASLLSTSFILGTVACNTQDNTKLNASVVIGEVGNSSVVASKTSGKEGDEVELTFTAEEGYSISDAKVNGESIEIENNKYTFYLNAGENTVSVSTVATAYKANFSVDSHSHVKIYKDSKFANESTASYAVTRNPETGELTQENGDVYFVLSFDSGYELDGISVAEESYAEILGYLTTSVENGYEVTGISGDINLAITSREVAGETAGYKVDFVTDEHCSVKIYKDQSYSEDPVEKTTAYSFDNDLYIYSKNGSGQINYEITFDEGYELDTQSVNGTYKNIKGPSSTLKDNTYRITKIQSDLTITIASKKPVEVEPETDEGYKITFVTDKHTSINVFASKDYSKAAYENATYTFSRNADEGTYTKDASIKPQVNFEIICDEGYSFSSISVSGTKGTDYNKCEDQAVEGRVIYKITKIAADLTVTIKSESND